MIKRPDARNIDLMTLAGFFRNCLGRWYQEAAAAKGNAMTKDEAREVVLSHAHSRGLDGRRGRFIGNAVAPPLAEFIGRRILEMEADRKAREEHEDKVVSLRS